ncbi:MAG: hypothetical protein A2Y24_01405 [Clostridiales bacterium GWE2_32_10]|nr:MAG: hypothetical protein A2Y24_01405 [Clostridiales bacterium GWE2_32_10]HBY19986.1 bacteriocin [Clostridiales bacterium]
METSLMQYMVTQGVFAVLFTVLLFYVLKENSKRETSYQEIINKLSEKFGALESGIEEIKLRIDNIKKSAQSMIFTNGI